MKFKELKIDEAPFDTFQDRGTLGTGAKVSHGGSIATKGGTNWKKAAAGKMPDQIAQKRQEKQRQALARSTGTPIPTQSGKGQTKPGEAKGRLIISPAALTSMRGASRMTKTGADRQIRQTIGRGQIMADIYGGNLTVNDAIPKQGSSRETNTPGSQHFHGNALDISTAGMSNEDKIRLFNAAMQAGFTGFGFGNSILHVDTGQRRHWDYGNSKFAGVSVASLGNYVARNRTYALPGRTAIA